MSDLIKIKVRKGEVEVGIEAARPDAEELLEKWWSKLSTENNKHVPQTSSQVHKSGAQATRPATTNGVNANSFDANELANRIKEHTAFGKIEEKIIHKDGDAFHKITLVLSQAEEALTSGQIHNVLGSLQIKIALSGVSKTLERNMGSFITSGPRKVGGTPPTYKLTAKAISDFEKWLFADG